MVNRTQSNSIELNPRLSSIEFGNRTKSNSHKKKIGQSNSIEHLISELLIFVKLVLKIKNKFFETRVTSVWHVILAFFKPHKMTFVQANLFTEHNRTQSIGLCSIEFGGWTQSNTIWWIEFDWVRFVRLSSIGSEIELTQSSVFDSVRLPNSIHGLNSIEFDFRTSDWLCQEYWPTVVFGLPRFRTISSRAVPPWLTIH